MDRIRLSNMSFYGYHGARAEEREMGRRFSFDVEMVLDLRPAALADDLAKTVDYAQVYRLVREVQESRQYSLLEALAEEIAARILDRFPVQEVVVRARKAEAPVGGLMDFAEVEICRRRGG